VKGNGLVLELTISLGLLMQVQLQPNVVLPIIAPVNICEQKFRCAVFQFTTSLDIRAQTVINKQWCCTRVWLYSSMVS